MPDREIIGSGTLGWNKAERVSDRYGTVFLQNKGSEPESGCFNTVRDNGDFSLIDGRKVTIMAEVIRTRPSTHVGDLFHGIRPETPHKGDRFELGTGRLFFEDDPLFGLMFGVRPEEESDNWWMDPNILYRCHNQDVIVWAEVA